MTAQELLTNIKDDLNENPAFDDSQIIRVINTQIPKVARKTDYAKKKYEITTTNGTFHYPVNDVKNFRIINVWYGQQSVRDQGTITYGHTQLKRVDRGQLGRNMKGYWLEKQTASGIAFTWEVNLAFDPVTGYYLIIEYTNWISIPQSAFDNDEDLQDYLPEEAQDIVQEYVVGRLKLRDRDATAKAHFDLAADEQEDLSAVEHEKAVFMDDEE